MKKKLIATLVAGLVLSTGLISFTACYDGIEEDDVYEIVDAEGWAAAFTASMEAKNFTVDTYTESVMKINGTLGAVNFDDMTTTTIGDGKIYSDAENYSYYSKTTYERKSSNVPDDLKDNSVYQNRNFDREEYAVQDGYKYYASYNGFDDNPEWEVSVGNTGSSLKSLLSYTYSTEEDGTTTTLSALYDAFTCNIYGVYSARLWMHGLFEVAVSVSFINGYVASYSHELTHEDVQSDNTMTSTSKTVCNFSNYGSTTVTPSYAAKQAVEEYKSNH